MTETDEKDTDTATATATIDEGSCEGEEVKKVQAVAEYRKRLPIPMVKHQLSIWQILKSAIGKDLSRMAMPIEVFEPLSVLQVFCEELEYSELLDKACNQSDPIQRMGLVAAFAISRYGSTKLRGQGKPFNPLEGETFECVREELGWTYMSEQVSHHPGIAACYGKGRGWEMNQSAMYDLAFWGKYVLAKPKTPVEVTLYKFKETYRWNRVRTTIHNLFSGTRYIDHHGEMEVLCSTKFACKLYFKKLTHEIYGHIKTPNNATVGIVSGKWSEYFNLDDQRLWTARPLPSYASEQYGFGHFAASLNELTNEMKKYLPPTDTRFRPDQRCLEEGNIDGGRTHKNNLEVAQRKRRKDRNYVPKWFTDKTTKESKFKLYAFNHRYWDARQNGFSGEKFDKLW